ncbi:hypothetical protein DOS48_14540 (plasmid) [Halorubrum sp. PV6]|nr:hypothetical protein DOS48_14540 [Halorubrum sp. PV6]
MIEAIERDVFVRIRTDLLVVGDSIRGKERITLVSQSMNDNESPDKYSRRRLNKEIALPITVNRRAGHQ